MLLCVRSPREGTRPYVLLPRCKEKASPVCTAPGIRKKPPLCKGRWAPQSGARRGCRCVMLRQISEVSNTPPSDEGGGAAQPRRRERYDALQVFSPSRVFAAFAKLRRRKRRHPPAPALLLSPKGRRAFWGPLCGADSPSSEGAELLAADRCSADIE